MIHRIYNHILVPTDFGPQSRHAYRPAFAIALATGAPVTLLHVKAATLPDKYRGLDAVGLLHLAADRSLARLDLTRPDSPEAIDRCHRRLGVEVHPDWAASIEVRTEVRVGDVPIQIACFAEEAGVDLIVMAGSRPGLLPTLSRRMADQVARRTPVKILRVTPPVYGPRRGNPSDGAATGPDRPSSTA